MSSLNMAATRNNNSMWFGHPMALAKGGGMETSVLEIQRAVLKLQQQQPMSTDQLTHQFPQLPTQQLIEAAYNTNDFSAAESELSDILARPVKADPGLDYGFGWPEFEGFVRSGVTTTTTSTITTSCCCNNNMDMSSTSCSCGVDQSTNTTSCPPSSVLLAGAAAVSVHATKEQPLIPEKWSVAVGRESFNKRKAVDKTVLHPPKPEDGKRVKKIKEGCVIDEEKNNCTANGGNSKKNMNVNRIKGPSNNTEFTVSARCTSKSKTNESKPAYEEDQKTEYIHVRARRGQATDSHSLAERVRRERISERMKYLQDLVPGCDKVTGKAGMLDEIINYVQSLQRQVEFLSMKLASVSPTIDLNFDDILAKQVYAAAAAGYSSNYPMTMGAEMMTSNSDNNIHYDQITHQVGQNCEIDMVGMGVAGTRRTISTYPVETSLDSSSLMLQHKQMQSCLAWDTNNTDDLHHTIYSTMEFNSNQQQSKVGGEGQSVFPSHQPLFSGTTEEAGCLKMEM